MSEDEIIKLIVEEMPEVFRTQTYCSLGVFRVLNHVISALEPQRSRQKTPPSFSYCEATEGSVYVFGPDGRIYICPDSIIDPRWAVGSYSPELSMSDADANQWRRDIFSDRYCSDCEIATFCGGGCALVPLDSGDEKPFCNGAKEELQSYLSAWLRRRAQSEDASFARGV
jgi:uncharacterized protein